MLPGKKETNPISADFGYMTLDGAGSENDMNVDGSATPQWFEYRFSAQDNRHYQLINGVLTMSGGKLDDPQNFAGLSAPLTNGIEIGWITYSQGTETDYPMRTIKDNYDMVSFASASKPWGFTSDNKDVMVVQFFSDYEVVFDPKWIRGLYLIVRDDLTDMDGMRFGIRGISV